MSKPQEIIEIEQELGIELEETTLELLQKLNSYVLNNNKEVIGLRIVHNKISHATFRNLKSLTYLNLEGNEKLKDFSFISYLTNLTNLSLRFCNIKDIPQLQDLVNLQVLDLKWNKIKDISALKELNILQELNLQDNQVTDISPLLSLKKLQKINLSGNKIEKLPKEIAFLPNLVQLDLTNNIIINVPEKFIIEGLKAIREFWNDKLLYNIDLFIDIYEEHDEMSMSERLRVIFNLTSKKFKARDSGDMWQGIGDDKSEFEKISSELYRKKAINTFINYITRAKELTFLNPAIIKYRFYVFDKVEEEKTLNLSSLELQIIPKEVFHRSSIQSINLSSNQISDISGLIVLGDLESLYLTDNQITQIPVSFFSNKNFPKLKNLSLKGNPINNIPPEIFNKDGNVLEEVRNYFIALEQGGTVLNNQAKVILFGNSQAGKTTLYKQLKDNVFDEAIESTHGILLDKWEIDTKDFPPAFRAKMEQIIVNIKTEIEENPEKYHNKEIPSIPENVILSVWDFGGQEYYHATHRLFLNSNAFYLLVWETETNQYKKFIDKDDFPQENQHKDYWEDSIHFYTEGENTTLSVQNKVKNKDDCKIGGKNYKIAWRQKGNEDSIKEHQLDANKLKKAIFDELTNLEYLGKPFPRIYDDIRQDLEKKANNFLTFEIYHKICNKLDKTPQKIMSDESQIRDLTTFLHNIGVLICYSFDKNCPEEIKNYIFIKPQWVTDMIYQILDKDVFKNNGEFDKLHVEEKARNSGVSAETWISLMKKFELIFEIKKNEKTLYIAPQYLPLECLQKEELAWALDPKPSHCFTLYFPKFLPKSLFLQFIAHYGSQNVKYLYWKNGLVLKHHGFTVFAKCDYENRKISVAVQNKATKTVREIYQWFKGKINQEAEISINKSEFEKIDTILNVKYRTVYQKDYWFIFGEDGLTQEQQAILNLIDEAKIYEVFTEFDKLGVKTPEYINLKTEFISGKTTIDFYDRLKVFVRKL
jgi:Leucine-rich repeat (LRR) protein